MNPQHQKILLIANWKMNPVNFVEAEILFKAIKKETAKIENVEIVICPPFTWLALLKKQITPGKQHSGISPSNRIYLGGQNCFWKEKGAYTGEISPKMLKNLGCDYVILGHSERRGSLGETNQMINKKIQAALNARLKPIVCIGEKEREANDLNFEEIKTQILESFQKIQKVNIQNIIIAYEPVWAIGSGKIPSENDLMKAVILIRRLFNRMYDRKTTQKLKILYGGSVSSRNVDCFISNSGINGFLIGKASLNVREFVRIIKSVSSQNSYLKKFKLIENF